MKRHGIVNSSIAKVLADLGHTDWIVIGDLGLPVPKDIPKPVVLDKLDQA
ncbi:D-ribose pyranase [Bacillus smithii 7_3_47FAA]|uniref:D-ribose pyranase n=1 Tax=Bacillus smithii 7_3_47FAA TaxID=665952 RepID=G9QJE4_9BACI|nr:D-ribose pyranase [Bacillus smithii 7_3_47FAA]